MSDTPRAKVNKLDGYRNIDDSTAALGEMLLMTPRGQIKAVDAPGFTSMIIEKPGGEKTVGVLLYIPGSDPNELGSGMIAQLSPESARALSKSFAKLADMVGAGV